MFLFSFVINRMIYSQYVQELMHSGHLDGAAVLDCLDGLVLAHSDNFIISEYELDFPTETGEKTKLKIDEACILVNVVTNKGFVHTPPGIWIAERHYRLISFMDEINTAYLKCPNGGATVTKTNKLIIVGVWSQVDTLLNRSAGHCNTIVEKLAQKLTENNL